MRQFLIDNQLPQTLVQWLEGKGYAARHVLDLNLAQATDEVIWLEAVRRNAVIISKDEDFARFSVLRTEGSISRLAADGELPDCGVYWRRWSVHGLASESSLMRERA